MRRGQWCRQCASREAEAPSEMGRGPSTEKLLGPKNGNDGRANRVKKRDRGKKRDVYEALPSVYRGADAEGGRHGPGEAEEDEAGRGGVLYGGQEWRARGKEAECAAG